MMGIYCYEDTLNDNQIVYVGKDSHISKHKRHGWHIAPSCRDKQQINRVIQDNPERYNYRVLKQLKKEEHDKRLLDVLEILYIRRYNPLFNFTLGGGGGRLGIKLSEETRKKISEAKKGKQFSKTHRENLSKALKGRKIPRVVVEHMSEAFSGKGNPQYKDFPRIIKNGTSNGKQNYAIKRNLKRIKQSIYLDKLIKWFKLNYPDEELYFDDL